MDEKASLTYETRGCKQDQPVIPSQTFDHEASHKEAQTCEEDGDGHERNGDGDEGSSVSRVGLGLRRALGISLSGYNVGLHLGRELLEKAERYRLRVRV